MKEPKRNPVEAYGLALFLIVLAIVAVASSCSVTNNYYQCDPCEIQSDWYGGAQIQIDPGFWEGYVPDTTIQYQLFNDTIK